MSLDDIYWIIRMLLDDIYRIIKMLANLCLPG